MSSFSETESMQNDSKAQVISIQRGASASRCPGTTSKCFKPITNLRVMLTPATKSRLMRRFFELGHSIRHIARSENMSERAIEQIQREAYWALRKDDTPTGPIPVAAIQRRAA